MAEQLGLLDVDLNPRVEVGLVGEPALLLELQRDVHVQVVAATVGGNDSLKPFVELGKGGLPSSADFPDGAGLDLADFLGKLVQQRALEDMLFFLGPFFFLQVALKVRVLGPVEPVARVGEVSGAVATDGDVGV